MDALVKFVNDSRQYTFDFKLFAELIAGQTISSATVTATPTSSPALTIGPPTISGSQVTANISGGLANTLYTLAVDITTSTGSIIEGRVLMTCRYENPRLSE